MSQGVHMSELLMTSSALLMCAVSYIFFANWVRFARVHKMHTLFGYRTRASFARMTIQDAQRIQLYLYQLEFPFVMQKALEFALFRTYGLPSISTLLVETMQLTNSKLASKRVDDTRILIIEFVIQSPTSERALSAIARMNYIHSFYQKSGKISNHDMLYTLSLFALEPIRWVARYEWRAFTDMERCAVGVFWKGIGDAMKIDFTPLPSAKAGWKDGLDWLAELESWSMSFEAGAMLPDTNNKKTADQTINVLLWRIPSLVQPLARHALSSLMDERLRTAILLKRPNPVVKKTVEATLAIRKRILRYLSLPRPSFLRVELVSDPNQNGRSHKLTWDAEPWYVESSLSNRWSPWAWIDWLGDRPLPGDGKAQFKPEGFRAYEIGPSRWADKGFNECDRDVESIKIKFGAGCPMGFGKPEFE